MRTNFKGFSYLASNIDFKCLIHINFNIFNQRNNLVLKYIFLIFFVFCFLRIFFPNVHVWTKDRAILQVILKFTIMECNSWFDIDLLVHYSYVHILVLRLVVTLEFLHLNCTLWVEEFHNLLPTNYTLPSINNYCKHVKNEAYKNFHKFKLLKTSFCMHGWSWVFLFYNK